MMYALFHLDGDSSLILDNQVCDEYIYGGEFLVSFEDEKAIKKFENDFFQNGIYDHNIQKQMDIITRCAIISLLLGEENKYDNGNYSIKVFKNLNINKV